MMPMDRFGRIWIPARGLAGTLVLALALGGPVPAAPSAAVAGGIEGVVKRLAADASEPVAGARVLTTDAQTRELRSTVRTDDAGRFRVEGLGPGSYRVAVEADGGLYLSGSPVTLDEASPRRAVEIGLQPGVPAPAVSGGAANFFDDPLTATLTILGIAVVVGFLIGEVFGGDGDEGDSASPATVDER